MVYLPPSLPRIWERERDQMMEFPLRNVAEIIQMVHIGFTYCSICQRLHLFSKESLYLTRYEHLSACVDVILVWYNNLKKVKKEKKKKKTNNKQQTKLPTKRVDVIREDHSTIILVTKELIDWMVDIWMESQEHIQKLSPCPTSPLVYN